MLYWIILRNKRGEPYHHHDNFLPGVVPDHVLETMRVPGPLCYPSITDQGLCEHCTMGPHCHVIEYGTGRKYCTVLFHDAVKPKWRMADVL